MIMSDHMAKLIGQFRILKSVIEKVLKLMNFSEVNETLPLYVQFNKLGQ